METVFFDFETGGVKDDSPSIQLAAIVVNEDWTETASFEMKIQFDDAQADPEALRINHYDRDVWAKQAQPEWRVLSSFDSFLNAHKSLTLVSRRTGRPYSVACLAGHNVATFDMPRLRRMYGTKFLPADQRVLDTLQLALWYFCRREAPDNYQLTTLLKVLNIPFPNAHDALADVRASAALAKVLVPCMAEIPILEPATATPPGDSDV